MPPRLNSSLRRLSCNASSHPCPSQSSPLYLPSRSFPSPPPPLFQCRYASALAEPAPDPEVEKRKTVRNWLRGPGKAFRNPLPGATNYLSAYDKNGQLIRQRNKGEEGDESQSKSSGSSEQNGEVEELDGETIEDLRPFPLNTNFISQPVLSEELRNEIHFRVVEQGKTLREVSTMLQVDMKRVAAVVRLVELEKKMIKEGKPRALPYARAVHQMIPTTPLKSYPERIVPHESINDLPVHRLTEAQLFYPTSESRQFTRLDAGRVFSAAPALPHSATNTPHNTPEAIEAITNNPSKIEKVGKPDDEHQVLQPADYRIPHPHLVAAAHDRFHHAGEQRLQRRRFQERIEREVASLKERKEKAKAREEAKLTRIVPEGSRVEFRFRDVVVSQDTTGKTGRGTAAPGRRYGVPNYERKRGMVKIPTKVEV
ncbi:hypothetical protein FQN51_004560 [Onygenales sp. PD_10]|nr:hypothetical protein FQN51_004560 [Onygenales sp. PD_10]